MSYGNRVAGRAGVRIRAPADSFFFPFFLSFLINSFYYYYYYYYYLLAFHMEKN